MRTYVCENGKVGRRGDTSKDDKVGGGSGAERCSSNEDDVLELHVCEKTVGSGCKFVELKSKSKWKWRHNRMEGAIGSISKGAGCNSNMWVFVLLYESHLMI